MTIELSKQEVELLDAALEAWEREAHSGAMMGSLIGAMLTPEKHRDEAEAKSVATMQKADAEMRQRRMKSVMIRAKLYQAVSRNSEHEIEEKP